MKKLIAIVALCAMTLTACNESPRSVAESYISAVQKGDWKSAIDYTAMDPEAKELVVSLLEGTTEQGLEDRNKIERYTVTEELIAEDGQTATVKVQLVFADGHEQEQEIPLVLGEDGKWLVKDLN